MRSFDLDDENSNDGLHEHYFQNSKLGAASASAACGQCGRPLGEQLTDCVAKCRGCPLELHPSCAAQQLRAKTYAPGLASLALRVLMLLLSYSTMIVLVPLEPEKGTIRWMLFHLRSLVEVILIFCFICDGEQPFAQWLGRKSNRVVNFLGLMYFRPLIWLFPDTPVEPAVAGSWLPDDDEESSEGLPSHRSHRELLEGVGSSRARQQELTQLRTWKKVHSFLGTYSLSLRDPLILVSTVDVVVQLWDIAFLLALPVNQASSDQWSMDLNFLIVRLLSLSLTLSLVLLPNCLSLASWICSASLCGNDLVTAAMMVIYLQTAEYSLPVRVWLLLCGLLCCMRGWTDLPIYLAREGYPTIVAGPVLAFVPQLCAPSLFVFAIDFSHLTNAVVPELDVPAVSRLLNFVACGATQSNRRLQFLLNREKHQQLHEGLGSSMPCTGSLVSAEGEEWNRMTPNSILGVRTHGTTLESHSLFSSLWTLATRPPLPSEREMPQTGTGMTRLKIGLSAGLIILSIFLPYYLMANGTPALQHPAFIPLLVLKTVFLIPVIVTAPRVASLVRTLASLHPILYRFDHKRVQRDEKLQHPQRVATRWTAEYYDRVDSGKVLNHSFLSTKLIPSDVIDRCGEFLFAPWHIDARDLDSTELEGVLHSPASREPKSQCIYGEERSDDAANG